MLRNRWPASSGIGGRNQSEYAGGITIGILDSQQGWIEYRNHKESGKGVIGLDLFNSRKDVSLMIAACNDGDGLPLKAELRSLALKHLESGLKARIVILLQKALNTSKKKWRGSLLPWVSLARLSMLGAYGAFYRP